MQLPAGIGGSASVQQCTYAGDRADRCVTLHVHTMESQTHKRGGRPTKYKEEYVDALIEYFETFAREPYTREVIERSTITKKNGDVIVTEKFKLVSKTLPTLFDFARQIEVAYGTVNRWANERIGPEPEDLDQDKRPYRYPEFREAYNTRVAYQTQFLASVGLSGAAPSIFAIFTSKNVIGWRDKNEVGFTDGAGKDVKPQYIVLPRRMSDSEVEQEYATAVQQLPTELAQD